MKDFIKIIFGCVLGISLALGFMLFVSRVEATADFNKQINYQGKLTNSSGVAVANNDYCMQFNIYDALTDGTLKWSETWNSSSSKVALASGLFSVMLGKYTAFTDIFNGSALYLEIKFDPDTGCTTGNFTETFAPRKQLGTVPSAIQSAYLEGGTWEAPGTIGSGTPNTGKFTSVTGTSFVIGANTISDFANLKSLAGLSWSSGSPLIKMTAAGTFELDASAYLTGVTADAPLSGSGTSGSHLTITSADATHAGSVPLSGTPATNQYLRATQTTGAVSWQQIAYADVSGTPDLSGYVPYTGASSTVNLGSQNLTTTGTISGLSGTFSSLTSGRIPYASTAGLLADTANFVWDNSNVRLGIGLSRTGTSPLKELDISGDIMITQVAPPLASFTLTEEAGAYNLTAGVYYYAVEYVTAVGDTSGYDGGADYPKSITIAAANARVQITGIPVSTDPRVTGRKIYRTLVGGGTSLLYYLDIINNNTATTYTDNIADAGRSSTNWRYRKDNTTTQGIYRNAGGGSILMLRMGTWNFGVGSGAVDAITGGEENFGFGKDALTAVSTGTNNVAMGSSAAAGITIGAENTAVGDVALSNATTSYNNTAVGSYALSGSGATLYDNTAVGRQALAWVLTGDYYNTALGSGAGRYNQGGDGNILIGYYAGRKASATAVGSYNITMGYSPGLLSTTGSNNILIGDRVELQVATGSGQLSIGNLIIGTGLAANLGTTLSTGNIGIGVAAPSARLHLPAGTATASTAPLKFTSGTVLGTPEAGAVEYDGTNFKLNGGVVVTGTYYSGASAGVTCGSGAVDSSTLGIVTGCVVSDIRYKKNVTELDSVLEKISKIRGVTYNLNEDYLTLYPEASKGLQIGMIAQEVQEQFPELVAENSDGSLTIRYMYFAPVLLEAIKELNLKVSLLSGSGTVGSGSLSFAQLTAEKAKITTAEIQRMQMVDQANGDVYCTWIANGEWVKVKGDCSSVAPAVFTSASQAVQQPSSTETPTPTPEPSPTSEPTPAPEENSIFDLFHLFEPTPEPTPELTPTPAPEPTLTPTPEPSPTPEPEAISQPESSLEVTPEPAVSSETPLAIPESGAENKDKNSDKKDKNSEMADILQDAGANLLKGAWNFIKYIFDSVFGKVFYKTAKPQQVFVPTPVPTPTPQPTVKILDTPTGWLNVHSLVNGETITKVYPGEIYKLAEEKDGWYQIILQNGEKGWLSSKYAEK